jgi:GDPmannose 4,6-dehydratase
LDRDQRATRCGIRRVAFSYADVKSIRKEQRKEVIRSHPILNLILNLKTGSVLIEIDPRYFRPTEVDFLLADASNAKKKLGWVPKITFKELVKIMVDADME